MPAGAHPFMLLLCRSWVLVSWIWSLIWHMPLDLIKWIMAYILNEDGFRQRIHGKKPTNIATETANVDLPDQARALLLHAPHRRQVSACWALAQHLAAQALASACIVRHSGCEGSLASSPASGYSPVNLCEPCLISIGLPSTC